jgi:hypothetical protein
MAPRLIKPGSTFYVQGWQGADPSLPSQAVWGGRLFRTDDLLVLDVTIWQKSATEGFIAFDFPPQHIVEQLIGEREKQRWQRMRPPRGSSIPPARAPTREPGGERRESCERARRPRRGCRAARELRE